MTLPNHEYCIPSLCTGRTIVARGPDAGFTVRLQRRALAQYLGLVFSLLDGVRAVWHCVGTRSPRNFQGLGAARGTTRALRRHAGDCLCRNLCDVVDMA